MTFTIKSARAISLALVALPVFVFAQDEASSAAPPTEEFCNDTRSEIRNFCRDLDRFQRHVNDSKAAGKPLAARDFANDLNHLDLHDPDARVKFITVLAPQLAESAAVSTFVSKVAASGALADAGQQRLDRQLAPNSASSGTTSLVSKAGSAELLALALDTGALTRSVNGTTATLSTNADQLFRLITNNNPDCTVTCVTSNWFQNHVLSPTTLTASMDLAQTSNKTVPTSGQAGGSTPTDVNTATIPTGAGKLSSFTARYEVANKFDPRSAKFKQNWKNAVAKEKLGVQSNAVKAATDAVTKSLQTDAPALDTDKILSVAQSDPSGMALANFFFVYLSQASQKVSQDPNVVSGVAQVMQSRALYREAWFAALRDAVGNMCTFEYNYNRPANQPITNNLKVIFARDFRDRGMLTFNGSVSLYGTIPAGAKYGNLYYGQVSTQYDRTLTGKDKSIQTQMTLAGYWQYQPNPSVLNIPAGTVAPGTTIPIPNGTQEFVGTAGSLWVTQAKFTIKAAGGINIPIGVSWSNKTDLLQGSKVGAQLGISYNFSSLAGIFTGGQ